MIGQWRSFANGVVAATSAETPASGSAARDSRDVRRLAVLGSPIAHSKSPVLHQAAYAALVQSGLGEKQLHALTQSALKARQSSRH